MTQHKDGRSDLISVIHSVRRRWRQKLVLRGAAIAAGCVAVALVGSAITLQWMRFTSESILLFRVLLATVVAVAAYLCVIRPLLRSVSDEQVALYLEEHEPSLEAAIISAVEAEGPGQPGQSPALVRKLVENAVQKVRALEDGVLTDIREGDVGAILGWGFAPWSGGPFSWLDIIGAAQAVSLCQGLAARHGPRFTPPVLLIDMAARGERFYANAEPKVSVA